ncbi:MAG: hypothetical protein O9333_17295 [Beijerinckiaceae bacterium]|jgi:hypothetical protein|nr:hypothetical protein [Beijerinckiaceae bacterium]MCZ8376132.1 hypothetical protein [Beijerinckiaceae bacterium]
MNTFKKTLAATAAALTMAVAFAPAAEAKFHRNGWLAAGLIGGAVIGTAIAANNAHAAPVYHAPEVGPDCYRVRERVWDDYRGRFVTIRKTVCE